MEDRRAEIGNSNLETMEFIPDFKSSVIQANKPIQKVKIFKGAEADLLQEQINEFLVGKSLVNIQMQVCARLQDIYYCFMIHYLGED